MPESKEILNQRVETALEYLRAICIIYTKWYFDRNDKFPNIMTIRLAGHGEYECKINDAPVIFSDYVRTYMSSLISNYRTLAGTGLTKKVVTYVAQKEDFSFDVDWARAKLKILNPAVDNTMESYRVYFQMNVPATTSEYVTARSKEEAIEKAAAQLVISSGRFGTYWSTERTKLTLTKEQIKELVLKVTRP